MPLKTFLFGLFAWLYAMSVSYAQSNALTIEQAYLVINVDSAYQNSLPTAIHAHQLDSIPFHVKVVAYFSDTSIIDSVHFRVGRVLGGQDILAVSFAYKGGALPISLQEFIYSEGGFSSCVAESVLDAYTLYLEIWADDKMGNTTAVYRKQIN